MRNFQILIVSAVKICKQCHKTASASQTPYGGFVPGRHLPLNENYTVTVSTIPLKLCQRHDTKYYGIYTVQCVHMHFTNFSRFLCHL